MSKHKSGSSFKKARLENNRHKEDTSPHIHQRDKISETLFLRQFPWSEKQLEFIKVALDKNTKMIIANGVPGSSKTLLSIFCCLSLMNQKKISDLIFVRSLVQAKDSDTGYLSGDLQEKTMYYNIPLMDKLEELLPRSQMNQLIKDERVTCYPTSMLRGYQWATKGVVLDEAQNMMFDSLLTATTRIAEFSKLFVIGDTKYQNDLGAKSGFKKFCDIFNTEECKANGIHYFEFGLEDIKRSKFCRFVMEKIEEYDKKITQRELMFK